MKGKTGQERRKILVVEDEESTARAVRAVIRRRFDADVDIAPDLGTARRLMTETGYDLVMLDQALPDGSGLSLLRELRDSGEEVPVVMCSAIDPCSLGEDPLEVGAADYVVKDENILRRLTEAVALALGIALTGSAEA